MAIKHTYINESKDSNSLDIELIGSVGGSWFYEGITAQYVLNRIKEAGDKTINITLSSLGGDTNEGLQIHDLLLMHKGTVNVSMIGLVASAGTIVAMGATNKPKISKNGAFLVHQNRQMGFNSETADEKREAADNLDTIDGILIEMYSNHTGQTKEDIASLMKEERWLSAQEALEYGFVSEIFEPSEKNKVQNSVSINNVTPEYINSIGLPKFEIKNTQESVDINNHKKNDNMDEKKTLLEAFGKFLGISNDAQEPKVVNYEEKAAQFEAKANESANLLASAQAELDAMKVTNSANATAIAEANEQKAELQNKISDFENQISEKDAKITELEAEIAKNSGKKVPKSDDKSGDTDKEPAFIDSIRSALSTFA